MKKYFLFFSLLFLPMIGCTKVMVHGTDYKSPAVTKTYNTDVMTIMNVCNKTLESLGYKVTSDYNSYTHLITGWQATTSDSHYMNLFGRRDYAAGTGAYYQMDINVIPEGTLMRVSVFTTVKTVAGKLVSSKVVEKKFFNHLDDMMRAPEIDITNVGVVEK